MRALCITCRQEDKINTEKTNTKRRNHSHRRGKLSIIGIGPGRIEHLSQRAINAINKSQVIVGYNTYLKLLEPLLNGKEIISSGMTQEIKRVDFALEKARAGKNVSLVSSGDSGVYGMAGVALELLKEKDFKKIDIEIVPGIMAACAAGSLLGAPLMHDFAVISLSDLLTKWETIEKRIEAAAYADFVIAIYNPRSKNRTRPLEKAWKIIARYRASRTPVGIVKNAYRKNEVIKILSLKDASLNQDIDMTTIIIVGNSKTYRKNQYMITPRGYNLNK